MADQDSELERFGAWREDLHKAESDWRKLLPAGTPISVVNGPSYLVAGIERKTRLESRMPQTPREWRQLGWTIAKDGARSLHPKVKKGSALAKAAKRLAAVLREPPHVSCQPWARLSKTGERLAKSLDEQPDPATTAQRDELQFVHELVAETVGLLKRDAAERDAAERAARERAEQEERLARRIVELQGGREKDGNDVDEERIRLSADTPWGRAILAHLLRQPNRTARTQELLDIGITEAETTETKGKKTVQNCLRIMRRTCARQGGCPPCSDHLNLMDYPPGKTRGVLMLTQKGVDIAEAQKRGDR